MSSDEKARGASIANRASHTSKPLHFKTLHNDSFEPSINAFYELYMNLLEPYCPRQGCFLGFMGVSMSSFSNDMSVHMYDGC